MSTAVICAVVEASCKCLVAPGHESPHVCACGGSWQRWPDGRFEMYALPGSDPDWQSHEAAKEAAR